MECGDHTAVGRRQNSRSSEASGSTEEGYLWRGRGRTRTVNRELKDGRGIRQPCLQCKETVAIKCIDTCKALHPASSPWQPFDKCGLLSVMGRELF